MSKQDDTFSTADTIAPSGTRPRVDLTRPLPIESMGGGNPRKRSTLNDPTGMTAFGADGLNTGRAAPRLEAHHYAEWRAGVAASEARGEDYYADFARRARERSEQNVTRKLVNGIKGAFGKKKQTEHAAPQEVQGHVQRDGEGEARENDGVVR